MAPLPEVDELDAIDRFVVVERAGVKEGQPQREGCGKREEQREGAPAAHLFGSA
jgi:hypothetical protein